MQFVLLVLVIVGGLFFLFLKETDQSIANFSFLPLFSADYEVVHIGEVLVQVGVANTPDARIQGLSGRTTIGEKDGMLFVFPESDYHGVWMKDMRFPVDVVWIDEDLKVVDVARNLTPDSYPKIYEPRKPAKYVLETDVLFIETFNIGIGQTVEIPRSLRDSY